MNIAINKAKLSVKQGTLDIHFIKTHPGNVKVPGNETWKEPWHDDLQKAFEDFAIHLAILADYIPADSVDIDDLDPITTESFHVTSFSLGGDDNEGIVISGHKISKSGKAVILNTPFSRFTENEQSRYKYMDDVQEKVDTVLKEIVKFLDGSKRGTDTQGKLDFPKEEKVTKINVVDPMDKGELSQVTGKVGHADPDAMDRVKKMTTGKKATTSKPKKTKRVAQSAANPGGVAEVTDAE